MSSLWYPPLHLSWSFGHDDLHSTINKVSLIRTIFYSTQFSIFVQVSVGGKFMPMKKSLFDPLESDECLSRSFSSPPARAHP